MNRTVTYPHQAGNGVLNFYIHDLAASFRIEIEGSFCGKGVSGHTRALRGRDIGESGCEYDKPSVVNRRTAKVLKSVSGDSIAGASNDTEIEIPRGDARYLHRHATRNEI